MATVFAKTTRSRMTKETFVVFALLVSITLAGFNTGNNLLYLIAGVITGSILIALIAGRINLSRLVIRRRFPPYVFAGHGFRANLEIVNNKKFFNSFGVNLNGTGAGLFLSSIEARGKQTREVSLLINQRGIQHFSSMTLSSSFPFGFFDLRKKATDPQEIVVYPCIHDVSHMIEGAGHAQDDLSINMKGPGTGMYGLREYHHGESAANISWKMSAKLDKLTVRETEREEKRRVCIVLDNAMGDDSPASLEAFEQAVSTAASLIWHLSRNGYSVKLVTREKTIGYGVGPDHVHRMLIALALIKAVKGARGSFPAGKGVFEGGTGVLVACTTAIPSDHSTNGFDLVILEKIRGDGK